jgi:lysophospholipase L1-like esterase
MKKNKKYLYSISVGFNILFILVLIFLLIAKGKSWYQTKTLSAINHISKSIITTDDNNYKTRESIFSSIYSDKQQNKIVFLGDSITQNCNWEELFNNTDVLNRGIGGNTSEGVIEGLNNIIELKPKKIFIMIGVNDFYLNKSTDYLIKNYDKILSTLENSLPNTKIYVESMLPVNNTSIESSKIIDFNKKLEKLSSNKNIEYINLFDLYKNSNDMLNEKYTFDGTHLNGQGYLIWKGVVENYLKD